MAVLGVALVAGACTGGDVEATPSSTGPKPSPTVRQGEHTPDPGAELCHAVSTKTLRKLGITEPDVSANDDCQWYQYDSGDYQSMRHELTVTESTYTPPLTRRSYTATKEARARFRRLAGWAGVPTVPMRGFGDEAKVARWLAPANKTAEVWIAVRHRNTILEVKSLIQADAGGDRMLAFDQVEAGTLAAARELLAELSGGEQRAPSRVAYRDGELDTVRPVCSAVPAANRLAPGVKRWDTSPPGGRRAGCAWTENEGERPSLVVDVEAIAPSRTTGDSATAVARTLHYTTDGDRLSEDGLGDEAKLDWFVFEKGRSRTVEVVVRQRNLLVSVEYERWQHPDKEQMRKDAIGVARDILREYR